jgi:phosphoenolpyruvate carboxykinase (diphosphate)
MNRSPDTTELSRVGLDSTPTPEERQQLLLYINLRLRYLGCPTFPIDHGGAGLLDNLTSGLVALSREKDRLLSHHLCPVDQRIQDYLDATLGELAPRLPATTFVLDRHGLARKLSLPPDRDFFESDIVTSYRVRQGVLHNPASDRRTTQGIFHIADGGLPVPDDKKIVPREVFARLLAHALNPPAKLKALPYMSTQPEPAECMVSLMLRPVVCPEVPGFSTEKRMEIRFFVPGNLVSNLDFVESIFGNAGDPRLPENDAALDPEHWSGHTGCVVLAPHLNNLTKKELGLPAWDDASERQRRDGMCWRDPAELYNDGGAFKATCRDEHGVIVTVISDNYFGYCKKEVKTQISYAANLYGAAEEEHAGGALLFNRYDLSGDFDSARVTHKYPRTLAGSLALLGDNAVMQADGCAIDRNFPEIVYVPPDAHFKLDGATVSWSHTGRTITQPLRINHTYVLPSGYKVHLEKPRGSRSWRLVGTHAECTLCHKPCTVSGGGKSEISKSLSDAIIAGPVFVTNFESDMDAAAKILARDFSDHHRDPARRAEETRPILSPERSLGSVIQLLTPSRTEHSDEYNAWLGTIPPHVKELVLVVKRFHRPEWGDDWRSHFNVDVINGIPANELHFDGERIESSFLRVGFRADGSWRTFGLRKDFHPSLRIQMEDDITASVVVPRHKLTGLGRFSIEPALKFVHNCEYRLFQRPDDAIHRGYDHQTESDFARPDTFFSNYEPLTHEHARALVEDAIGFDQFTAPMQGVIRSALEGSPDYFVSTAHPRIVDGKPTKNPRYLQIRGNLRNPRDSYIAEVGLRFMRKVPMPKPVLTPVNAVLAGRRNNAADPKAGIRSLAVYNPLHHMELPELFMEFICSLTGKSPSTTGAGSEGALTKAPFNALPPIYDLNASFVSFAVTGYAGYLSAAGVIGPKQRVDHDISLLVPEVWCRMGPEERDPKALIAEGSLERCQDFEHDGRPVLASRLGWRITRRFVTRYCGRVFNHPHVIFTEEMLRPELQDIEEFVDGMANIVTTQALVAQHYFNDGSIEQACPPLRALLHVMRDGTWEGKGPADPEFRALFDPETVRASDWYHARLRAKQTVDMALWRRHTDYLERFLKRTTYAREAGRLGIAERLEAARKERARVSSPTYVEELQGTLGAEPAIVNRS